MPLLAATDPQDKLPVGVFPGLGANLKQARGIAGTGIYFQGFSFEGRDPLTGATPFKLRYARNQSMFAPTDATPNLLQPGGGMSAYSLNWTTDPKAKDGVQAKLNLVDVDKDFVAGPGWSFGAGMNGVRQQDFRVGWQQGTFAFGVGRDRLADKQTGLGLSRQVVSGGAYGFTYQREQLKVDAGAKFGGELTQRLLGAEGYDLGKRKLGDAKAGYSALTELAGMNDRFESFGYKHGDLSLSQQERLLVTEAGRLVDRRQQVAFGGLKLVRSSKSMDAEFKPFKEAGYGDWKRLVGGREDQTAATLDLKQFSAGWTQTRLLINPNRVAGAGTLTQTTEQRLLLRPIDELSLGYRTTESRTGAEKLWTGDRSKLTSTRESQYSLGWTVDQHRMTLGWRDYGTTKLNDRSQGVEQTVQYGYGKRTKLAYTERSEQRTTTKAKDETITVSHMQSISVETAFGVSALHERSTAGTAAATTHERVRIDRDFGPRVKLAGGYECWENAADSRVALAGYSGVMKSPVLNAERYDWSVTARPGTTELAAWQRVLGWKQAKAVGDFKAGEHTLSETGVVITQAVWRDFSLRGRWSKYERDEKRDQERREVAVVVSPRTKLPFIPTAEVGYREQVDRDGHTSPALFAGATLKPYDGLEVAARWAGQATEGAQAVADQWQDIDRRGFEVGATQALGQGGQAKVVYGEALASGAPALPDGTQPHSQDLTFGFTAPTNWLLGLKLTGQYHTRHDPGTGDDETTLREHQASLAWSNSDNELMASFNLRSTLRGTQRDGEQRLEFQYTRKFADSEFALTGFLHDSSDDDRTSPDSERYRVGFHYSTPF